MASTAIHIFDDKLDSIKSSINTNASDSLKSSRNRCLIPTTASSTLCCSETSGSNAVSINRTIDNIGTAGGRVLGSFLTGLIPDRVDTAHYGYGYGRDDAYEYAGDVPEGETMDSKQRERVEKRLRRQERALLKQQNKQRKRESDEDTLV